MTTTQTNQITFPFNGNVSLREAARIYVGEGFSIIPLHWITRGKCSCGKRDCASPAKHPLTQHGLKDASNDLAQIKTWWRKFPKANIGICTGSASGGLIVIDVDIAKGGSVTAVDIPITLEVETGNGFHFWLRSDREIRNSAGKLGQGIDIRGSGGYVVAPPSVHSNGRTYTFRNQDPIAELPDALIQQLIEPAPEPEIDDPDLVLSYAPDIPAFAPEGSRNDFLTKIGGKLRRQGFSQEEIEAALIAANLKRCQPPLADKEVRRIAQSVGRYIPVDQIETGIDDPEEVDFDPDLDLDSNPAQPPKQTTQSSSPDPFAQSGADTLLGAITVEQLKLTVFGRQEMILQGLYKGDWGLVVGIGSVGKTTFLHNLCICLAAGKPFPPIIPSHQPPRRILYLDFESNPWRLQQQIQTLCESLTDDENMLVDQNLHFAIEPQTNNGPWRMTDLQSLQNLAKYIKQHKIDLVVVDTLSQAAALTDENNNAEVQRKVVTPIRRLVKHCDVAVLLLHHEGKGKMQTGENYLQYKARGASSLIDAARYQITITPTDKEKRGVVEVVCSKDKGNGFHGAIMELDQKSRWFSNLGPITRALKAKDLIIETLESQAKELTLDELRGLILGISVGTMKNNLTELVKLGRVTRTEHGAYHLNFGAENGTSTS